MMQRFYIVPIDWRVINGDNFAKPKYIDTRFTEEPGDVKIRASFMNYGFTPYYLVLAKDISVADDAVLTSKTDVYAFPLTLDQSIAPQDNLDEFFEVIGVPTDWLTPANTYLEFLRQTAAMFQFNQRYQAISAGHDLIDDTGGLDTKYNSWSTEVQEWFDQTVESLDYDPAFITPNKDLRQLLKQVGDLWGDKVFRMGGVEF